jgi:hypothetical protein
MSPHPCDGHACDHCFCCDVLRICCGSISAGERARLEADGPASPDRLRAAVLQDAEAVVTLPELVRREARQRPQVRPVAGRPALPAASGSSVPSDSRKEALYVSRARQ